MLRILTACVVLAALSLLSAQPVIAADGDVTLYDTVDEIRVSDDRITVTGVITGQSAATTTMYVIANNHTSGNPTDVAASRCDRLALLAMSKPGKFRFGVVEEFFDQFSCKLRVRTP
jgi:hypothetical protein